MEYARVIEQHRAASCRHQTTVARRLIQVDAREVVIEVCLDCSSKVKTLPKRDWPATWRTLEIHRDNRCYRCAGDGCERCSMPCARCKSFDHSELHHWAPRHLFGDEANGWPMAFLCRPCHVEWHQRVTPNMGKPCKQVDALSFEVVFR